MARFWTSRLKQNLRQATLQQIEVISFDVFDTMLTRTVEPPQATFLLLGRQLQDEGWVNCSAEAFARARFSAEMRAFARNGGRNSHVNLDTIYTELAMSLGINTELKEALLDKEMELESKLLVESPPGVKMLEHWRQSGRKIVFTSDMYLSKEYIVSELEDRRIWQPGDECYVSSEFAAAKSTGSLFFKVLAHEQIPPGQLIHYGDDSRSDVRLPRNIGIRAVHLDNAKPNRYETTLGKYRYDTEGLSSAFAGASRIARLRVAAETKREKGIRDVSASVAAPLLTGFTLWLLHQAQDQGLRKLYFLSRDGQILMSIARKVAHRLSIDIELEYLHGSRQSWNLASLSLSAQANLDWIWTHRQDDSVIELLAGLGYDPESSRDLLNSLQVPQNIWNLPPTSVLATRLEAELISGRAASAIHRKSLAARAKLHAYLDSKQALSDADVGLVDLGGVGSQLRTFNLMRLWSGSNPASLFLLYRERNEVSKENNYDEWNGNPPRAYLFDESTNCGESRFSGMVPFLEAFCSADHGTVQGYEIAPTPTPIVGYDESEALSAWGLGLHREAIGCFVQAVILDQQLLNTRADAREAIVANLWQFVNRPSKVEARTWAQFPCEVSYDGSAVVANLSKPYSWREIAYRVCGIGDRRKWFHWREGSLALTLQPLRSALRIAFIDSLAVGRIARRWIRLFWRQA